jgi:hypothetical protein
MGEAAVAAARDEREEDQRRSSSSTSPSSGKRCVASLEKTRAPSLRTSNWLERPARMEASNPFCVSSAARLAARRS